MTGQAASPLDIFQLHLGDADHAFLLSGAVRLSGRIDEEQLRTAADRTLAPAPGNFSAEQLQALADKKYFAETLSAGNLKTHAIGIGAAEPFAGSTLLENAIDRFAGVPYLTNPGVIPGDPVNFEEALLQKSLVGSDQKYLNKRYFAFGFA